MRQAASRAIEKDDILRDMKRMIGTGNNPPIYLQESGIARLLGALEFSASDSEMKLSSSGEVKRGKKRAHVENVVHVDYSQMEAKLRRLEDEVKLTRSLQTQLQTLTVQVQILTTQVQALGGQSQSPSIIKPVPLDSLSTLRKVISIPSSSSSAHAFSPYSPRIREDPNRYNDYSSTSTVGSDDYRFNGEYPP